MARIAGVDLPRNKRLDIALTYLVGLGKTTSLEVIGRAGLSPDIRTDALTDDQISAIRRVIDQDYSVEGDIRRETSQNIKRLMDLGVYRGLRHRKGLPVRGQRTRTNAKARKGKGRPIAGKKKATK